MHSVVHVTHEAIEKIGGIGAVLQGLLTSKTYLEGAPRNILIGPFWPTDHVGEARLGPTGEVLYSSLDNIFRTPLAARFREIEDQFGVSLIYGRRKFADKATGVFRKSKSTSSNTPCGKSSASTVPNMRMSGTTSSTCALPRRRFRRFMRWG
jgi:hypothetical protein